MFTLYQAVKRNVPENVHDRGFCSHKGTLLSKQFCSGTVVLHFAVGSGTFRIG